MALEVSDYEESGQEKQNEVKVVKEVTPIQDENVLNLVKQLQEQIEELKQQKPNQQPTDQGALLEKLVDKISGNKSDTNGFIFEHNYVGEHDFDPEDVLEKEDWVTFVSHTVGHVIVDDLRNGKPVRVPFGKISFEYESTRKVTNGNEVDLYNLCKYTCKSKKELAWLQAHSKYGALFFDNIKGAKSVDGAKAIKLASVMRGLQAMGQHDIINTARNYGLNIGSEINILRGEIAQIIVEQQIKNERMITESRVNEANLESLIVGQQLK